MATKRETILAAIRTALTGTTGVGTRTYRSRVEPLARGELPAIVVEPTADNAEQNTSLPTLDWNLTVRPGNEDGTFGLPQVVATQSFDASIVLADLDADGQLDIATQSVAGGVWAPGWWRNTGGTFAPFESFDAPFGRC